MLPSPAELTAAWLFRILSSQNCPPMTHCVSFADYLWVRKELGGPKTARRISSQLSTFRGVKN